MRLLLAWLLCACAAAQPPLYRIDTVAGSGNIGDGGPALAAQFGAIQGIALDRQGNLYIADTDHHRVRKAAPGGAVSTFAGTGSPGFSGDGGPAAKAQLNLPYGITVDQAGNVYIADVGNQRVRRVAPDGNIATVAGNGNKGSGAEGLSATDSPLLTPRNLTVDSAGNLYISEFEGHRIRRVGSDGRIWTVAGTGMAGLRGDFGPASAAQLAFPAGLAIDRTGALLIADSQNNRVRRMVPGGVITTVLGGSPGTALATPIAVAVDPNGTIFVADVTATVRSFSIAGTWSTAAGTGDPGYSGDGGPAPAARLSAARDLATDPYGNLYIADGVRVRRIDSTNFIRTVAGDGYTRAVGDGGAAPDALLRQPSAVALDYSGNLYIADTGTDRVRRVDAGGVIRTFAGTGTSGMGPDGVPAIVSALYAPAGLAVTPAGTLLIADTYNHRVREVAADGRVLTVAGTGKSGNGPEGDLPLATQLRGPRALCFDHAGALYIVDTANHRVLRVRPGATTETTAGNGSPGDAGDGGPARLAQLNQPSACAVDSAGDLFIADTFSHRIRKVAPGGAISTVAGTGTAGYSGDDGAATTAALSAPRGVAVDDSGNVYIADTGNHRIRQVTPDGAIHTIAGNGAEGFSGDGGPAASAQVARPGGMALDGAGNLYFADTGNDRVRRLAPDRIVAPPPVALPPTPLMAVNAASMRPGPVAPGELLVLYGEGLGPESGVAGAPDDSGAISNLVAGVQVLFDGIPAPILYAQATQINVQAPYSLSGAASTHVDVTYNGAPAGALDLPVAQANPALFPLAVNQDGTPNAESNPAPRGTLVTFFGTGEGLTTGRNATGVPARAPYSRPLLPVALTVGGIAADLVYVGAAPGCAGEIQVNARVPDGSLPPGAAEVRLSVGAFAAPAFTIWVK